MKATKDSRARAHAARLLDARDPDHAVPADDVAARLRGVQSSSLQYTKAAAFRTQAVYLATEIGERMQANKTAAVGGKLLPTAAGRHSRTDCTAALCSPAASRRSTSPSGAAGQRALPNATISITGAAANPITTRSSSAGPIAGPIARTRPADVGNVFVHRDDHRVQRPCLVRHAPTRTHLEEVPASRVGFSLVELMVAVTIGF
jgi:Tfp pilus assembly protein PilV